MYMPSRSADKGSSMDFLTDRRVRQSKELALECQQCIMYMLRRSVDKGSLMDFLTDRRVRKLEELALEYQ